jgi:DNA-binding YbaB/EbfC family protein
MSDQPGSKFPAGDFKMPDLSELMKTAQKLQGDLARAQEELARKECEASAGGGMVTVAINGHFELVRVAIDKAAVDPADVGMLEDLVKAAVNQAVARMRELSQAEMAKVTGGLGMPGMPGF